MKKLRCVICGMIINDKNYNYNEKSFINSNDKEKYIKCPFCGVSKKYLKENGDLWKVGVNRLDEKTIRILDKATKLEVFNGEFYKEATKLAKDKKISRMFKDLSNVEMTHARVHKRLGSFDKLPKLRKPDYSKRLNSDNLLVEEANKREKHAVAFYSKYMDDVCCDVVKEVFGALSEVEQEHIDLTK